MGKAALANGPDGFKVRVAPPWSEEKLQILDGYLNGGPDGKGGFAKACLRAGGWYGLDLFAGPGLNKSETSGEITRGSPLIALDAGSPKADAVIIAERHPGACEALRHRTVAYGERAIVMNVDANAAVQAMLKHVPLKAPAFAFLDPEGADVHWSTVTAIANHKRDARTKMEQLVLFPVDMALVRMADDYPDRLTSLFGHDRWKAIREKKRQGLISAEQQRGDLVRLYADGFKAELGYEHVLDRQILTPQNRPLYFLIFATDHAAGESIMKHVFERVEFNVREVMGQETLFDSPPSQRASRLNPD